MKAYLAVTGAMFGLLGLAHGLRVFVESGDGLFYAHNLAILVIGVGLAVWAFSLLRARAAR